AIHTPFAIKLSETAILYPLEAARKRPRLVASPVLCAWTPSQRDHTRLQRRAIPRDRSRECPSTGLRPVRDRGLRRRLDGRYPRATRLVPDAHGGASGEPRCGRGAQRGGRDVGGRAGGVLRRRRRMAREPADAAGALPARASGGGLRARPAGVAEPAAVADARRPFRRPRRDPAPL